MNNKVKRPRTANRVIGNPVLVSAAPKNSLMYNNAYEPKSKAVRVEDAKQKMFADELAELQSELSKLD